MSASERRRSGVVAAGRGIARAGTAGFVGSGDVSRNQRPGGARVSRVAVSWHGSAAAAALQQCSPLLLRCATHFWRDGDRRRRAAQRRRARAWDPPLPTLLPLKFTVAIGCEYRVCVYALGYNESAAVRTVHC